MNLQKAVVVSAGLSFILISAAWSQTDPVLGHDDLPLAKNAWAVQAQGEYFSRQAAFDDDGQEVEGSNFHRMQGQIGFQYGITDKIFARAGLRYRQNSGLETSQGLESIFGRVGYGDQINARWKASLALQWRHPMFSVEREQTTLGLGDDGDELSVQANIFYQAKAAYLTALSVAYVVPNDLSPEIAAEIQQMITSKQRVESQVNFAAAVGMAGVFSLQNGPYQQDPAQAPPRWVSTNLYRSFNRQWAMPFGKIIAGKKNWTASVQAGYIMHGRSTDKGVQILGSISWRGGGKSSLAKKLDAFKEYTVEAMAIKISPRGKFIKIDQGLRDGVDRGAPADIYQSDYLGKNVLFAAGTVYQVGDTWAVIRILQKFKTEPLQTGMVVRIR
jgi:hypothetical protein